MKKDITSKLLTLKQASELLNCHPNTLRLWEQKGLLKAIRFGVRRDRKYQKTEILNLLNKAGYEQEVENVVLPSDYDLTRIDMTGTIYEKISENIKENYYNYQNLQREEIIKFDYQKFLRTFNTQINYFNEKDFNGCKDLAEKILHIITSPKYRNGSLETINLQKYKEDILKKINYFIDKKEPINFMLPAFPFKIANPLKSSRRDADLAEIGSFCKLNEINLQIKIIYKPGAKFTIFHDGHLYYRHFLHEKEDAERYFKSLKDIVRKLNLGEVIILKDALEELKKIKNFSTIYDEARAEMTNLWQTTKFNNEKVQKIIQSAKQNINLSDASFKFLYRINFLEDWDLSDVEKEKKKEINERAEKCAFEYMVVQHALEKADFFNLLVPGGIRLTVHPKEGHIGIFLVKRKTHLLPWMGVGVLKNNGEVSVHYESELLSSGKYIPVFLKGEKYPFFYREAEVIYEGTTEFKKLFENIVNSLTKEDIYSAFAFNSEYLDPAVRDLLSDVHKKLADKSIEDRAICRQETLSALNLAYSSNKNIQIKATKKEIPNGVIILNDRIINLLWGSKPSAFEIKDIKIVESYKNYFNEIWDKKYK
ncbi:MAG: L-tyrosine/L-tryptophan isonitrile synthase family protein [bacterium]|nr:L-tyrosine/L-tryptophan isonitrile synthase family protein [bacterium]